PWPPRKAHRTDPIKISGESHHFLKLRIERVERRFVAARRQTRQDGANRVACPVHVAADAHAAADIEENREANRRLAGIEILDRTCNPRVDNLKVRFLQISDNAASAVADRNRY